MFASVIDFAGCPENIGSVSDETPADSCAIVLQFCPSSSQYCNELILEAFWISQLSSNILFHQMPGMDKLSTYQRVLDKEAMIV